LQYAFILCDELEQQYLCNKVDTKAFHASRGEKQRKIIVLQIRKSEKQIYFSIFLIKHLKNILYQQKGITNM